MISDSNVGAAGLRRGWDGRESEDWKEVVEALLLLWDREGGLRLEDQSDQFVESMLSRLGLVGLVGSAGHPNAAETPEEGRGRTPSKEAMERGRGETGSDRSKSLSCPGYS